MLNIYDLNRLSPIDLAIKNRNYQLIEQFTKVLKSNNII